MRQALGILYEVHRTHAEGKETGENASDCGIRSGTWHDRRGGRNESCRGRRGYGLHTLQALGQTVLAIDHALHVAGTIRAQRLAAGAAIRDRRSIGMVGAVHENLLCVASITTGGSWLTEASITWLPS